MAVVFDSPPALFQGTWVRRSGPLPNDLKLLRGPILRRLDLGAVGPGRFRRGCAGPRAWAAAGGGRGGIAGARSSGPGCAAAVRGPRWGPELPARSELDQLFGRMRRTRPRWHGASRRYGGRRAREYLVVPLRVRAGRALAVRSAAERHWRSAPARDRVAVLSDSSIPLPITAWAVRSSPPPARCPGRRRCAA
jgi:hypothetical protein